MYSIIAHHRKRLFTIPEAYQLDHRINQAFRFGTHGRVLRGGGAGKYDFSFGSNDPPIGGYFKDRCFTNSHVSDWLGLREGHFNGSLQSTDDFPVKAAFKA